MDVTFVSGNLFLGKTAGVIHKPAMATETFLDGPSITNLTQWPIDAALIVGYEAISKKNLSAI